MHPQLIPEKHPMCGKVRPAVACMQRAVLRYLVLSSVFLLDFLSAGPYSQHLGPSSPLHKQTHMLSPSCSSQYMEALVKCREANPVMRYWGECNEITYQLSKCLVEEKKEFRAPRQAK